MSRPLHYRTRAQAARQALAEQTAEQTAELYAERDAAYRTALGHPSGPIPRQLGNVTGHARPLASV